MSLHVGTGKAADSNELLVALARGRYDHQFFSQFFLNRTLHDGQLEYAENANATINCLPTANRWGKTTLLLERHCHKNVYKTGGEPRYMDAERNIDIEKFIRLKYHTIHVAEGWETSKLVWEDAHKTLGESARLQALVKDAPRSLPPHITFIFGSVWKFNTLGPAAQGIDGNSFYHVSIDEAGWIDGLERMMNNVIRVRVADVIGTIDLVGTMKPGISRDFFKYSVRAGSYTGRGVTFAHDTGAESEGEQDERLDGSIRKYLREFFGREKARGHELSAELRENLARLGITEDELVDALKGGR